MKHEGTLFMPEKPQQLGDIAIGTIGPEARIANGEISEVTVDEIARGLETDEFYTDIDAEHGPNAAGGTFTLVVADALTTGRFRRPGATAKEHAVAVYGWLLKNRNDEASRAVIPRVCIDGRSPVADSAPNTSVVGGHDDDNPDGCGAQKRLGDIFAYIRDNGDGLRELAASLDVKVDDDTHSMIVANAGLRLAEGYVSPGTQLREAYVETAGEGSVTRLAGPHKEVVESVNKNPRRTLDRAKLAAVYGDDYQAFGADAGVFPDAAGAISESDEEAWQKLVAMLYYNEATGAVLAHHSLRLSVHA